MLGSTVHPFVNVAPEKPPVLSNFGSRQLSQTREFIHRGFRHPEKAGDFQHGENLAFRRRYTVKAYFGCCGHSVIHNGYGIGGRRLKL